MMGYINCMGVRDAGDNPPLIGFTLTGTESQFLETMYVESPTGIGSGRAEYLGDIPGDRFEVWQQQEIGGICIWDRTRQSWFVTECAKERIDYHRAAE